jgi:branched-subunit amino acid transport protein
VSTAWTVLVGLSIGIYALKASGPLLLGNRALPKAVDFAAALLPAALLSALVMVNTFAHGKHLQLDAKVFGLLAAAVALQRKANFVVVIVVAAIATAAARWLGTAL